MDYNSFLGTLQSANLESYFPSFFAQGITDINSLANLSSQDIVSMGIRSEDRKKVQALVQNIRSQIGAQSHRVQSKSSRQSLQKKKVDSSNSRSLPPPFPKSNHDVPPRSSKNRRGSVTISPNKLNRSTTLPSRRSSKFGISPPAPIPPPRHLIGNFRNSSTANLKTSFVETSSQRHASSGDELFHSVTTSTIEEKKSKRRSLLPQLDAYGVPVNSSSKSSRKTSSDLYDKIRVCVRKRPLNSKELRKNEVDIIDISGRKNLCVNEPKVKVDLTKYTEQHQFVFDEVFDEVTNNEEVYQRTAAPLVDYVFEGGKATCFAYGQTGSGKTFTMLDPSSGLYVLAAREIFGRLLDPNFDHISAFVSFYEIYQGNLFDLLNNRHKLFARENGKQEVIINGLNEIEINNVQHLIKIFQNGNSVRSTGSTGANADSSRSHAILQIRLVSSHSRRSTHGKLSFIDLAGSERGADRGDTNSKTRMEGSEINKSLLALKECIRALDQVKKHTPFRQSKLTQVLKDSFLGNSRTCMIATISPNLSNSEHTLNTLRYADRVKEMKSDATDTEDTSANQYEVNQEEDYLQPSEPDQELYDSKYDESDIYEDVFETDFDACNGSTFDDEESETSFSASSRPTLFSPPIDPKPDAPVHRYNTRSNARQKNQPKSTSDSSSFQYNPLASASLQNLSTSLKSTREQELEISSSYSHLPIRPPRRSRNEPSDRPSLSSSRSKKEPEKDVFDFSTQIHDMISYYEQKLDDDTEIRSTQTRLLQKLEISSLPDTFALNFDSACQQTADCIDKLDQMLDYEEQIISKLKEKLYKLRVNKLLN